MNKKTDLLSVLQKSDGSQKMINDCISDVVNSEKIIIFGAGVGGGALYDLLASNNLTSKILCWSDNNSLKFGKTYKTDELEIVAPQFLMERYGKRIIIIVASSAYDIIKKQLMMYGYSDEQIKLYNFAFMDLEYTDKNFIYDHIQDFVRAYGKMEDDKSRRIFVNILNYRITKDIKYLDNMKADVDNEHFQYFPDDIYDYSSQECLLDVGAYIGDTFSVFNEVYQEKWKHYYGLEADSFVFNELEKTVKESKVHADKISLYKIAAWNEKTTLLFAENAGSSKMSDKDDGHKANAVEADCIDNILKNCEVTFIKMDIEGAEYNALVGMKEILRSNRPILAVCVYHLREDFYKLTDFIEELMPGQYKYFMRQYRYTPTETVCYMVPCERVLGTINV